MKIKPNQSTNQPILYASRSETTLRTAMESTLAELHMDVQRIQKKLLTAHVFADSTIAGPDSTLYYLNFVKTVEGNYSRVAALAGNDNYNSAIGLLDSMLVNYRLGDNRIAEITKLKDLYSLWSNVHSAARTIANMDSSEVQNMVDIAENPTGGLASQKAQNALCFHYDICYDLDGQPKSYNNPRKPKPTYDEIMTDHNTINAYPNPSDQYITIAYSLLFAKENTSLQINDNLGRHIEQVNIGEVHEGQQLIDTRKYPSGMYFFQVRQDGKRISEGKFIVTH